MKISKAAGAASDSRPILIILERDRPQRDGWLVGRLVRDTEHLFSEILYTGTQAEVIQAVLDPQGRWSSYPAWIRKPLKAVMLLAYPSRWSYYVTWFRSEPTVEQRVDRLGKMLRRTRAKGGSCRQRKVVIFGRSSGARVATMAASDPESLGAGGGLISGIVCMSYPFKHPERGDEPERYGHLARLTTPCLIFQGRSDIYGGEEIMGADGPTYKMSSSIGLEFADTGHDFEVSEREWKHVIRRFSSFVTRLGRI